MPTLSSPSLSSPSHTHTHTHTHTDTHSDTHAHTLLSLSLSLSLSVALSHSRSIARHVATCGVCRKCNVILGSDNYENLIAMQWKHTVFVVIVIVAVEKRHRQ